MKFTLKNTNSCYPKTHYQFTFFSLKWINTRQVWSINLIILNLLIKVLKEKKETTKDNLFDISPAKTVQEAEQWCEKQLQRKCNN